MNGGIGEYIKTCVRGASIVKRYQNKEMVRKLSIAEHMFEVAQYAYILAQIEKKYGADVDIERVLSKAIFHDIIETKTGDIQAPAKYKTQEMKNAVDGIEKLFFVELEEQTKDYFPMEQFREFVLDPKTADIEGQIIKAADSLAVVIESYNEFVRGNKVVFDEAFHGSLSAFLSVDLKSVKVFALNELVTMVSKEVLHDNEQFLKLKVENF